MLDGSLAVPFHSYRCPSHMLGNVHKPRILYNKTMPYRILAVPPSSILLQAGGDDNLSESKKGSSSDEASKSSCSASLCINQATTVGIIGGASVDSTLNFLRKLVQWSSQNGEESLPFVLCSDPVLNKQLLSHERGYFPLLSAKRENSRMDHKPILGNLQSKRAFLESSGAQCIVMPCHISHSWHDEISRECSVPFLHMGECVAKELKNAKLRPLEAGSPLRIGVLATNATLTAGFYQEKLQQEGFEVVLPDKATMEHAVIPAFEALNQKDMEGARNLLRIALQVLLVRAVNTVILASDDMRNLLPRDDPLLKKCIDPMDALARSTINWARSVGKGA